MIRRKKFLIGGIILFLAVGYLGFIGFSGSATYYYTVGELLEQGSSIYDQNIRVNGQVTPGSVEQDNGSLVLKFTISDDRGSLPVIYQGAVPDSFKVGGDIVIDGVLLSSGIFQADTLMPKCPSKYTPE